MGGESSRTSIYGPRELKDEFHTYKPKEEREALLARIENIFSQANQRNDRSDSGGYCCCFGLLDPVANIRVNGIMHDAKSCAPPGNNGGGDMAQRSLDGLVAFLTCIFPYLPDAEALAYLDAADFDPLVAARLIVTRRGLRGFDVGAAATMDAVETALRHAAVAARHPDPQLLVSGWKSVSAGLQSFASHLSDPRAFGRAVTRLIQTPKDNLELRESWELATCRLERLNPIGKELPPIRAAMKRMLLATIHEFYLKALGSLPRDELTHRYHRSLLQGGYCYGPLDPVENIIVNTVWHEQNFPSRREFKTFLISTSCLWQVAARSMYGLVSFLCTRYPGLTPDLALQRLLMAGANLRKADPYLVDNAPGVEELDWSEAPQIGSGMNTTASMQKTARFAEWQHPWSLPQKHMLLRPPSRSTATQPR